MEHTPKIIELCDDHAGYLAIRKEAKNLLSINAKLLEALEKVTQFAAGGDEVLHDEYSSRPYEEATEITQARKAIKEARK